MVTGWDLNPGPLSLEAGALLTELMRPEILNKNVRLSFMIAIFSIKSSRLWHIFHWLDYLKTYLKYVDL